VHDEGEASCFYHIRISMRTTPPVHLYTMPPLHDYGDRMSKEETVYVENQLKMDVVVKVKRADDGDIEVYLEPPKEEDNIRRGGSKTFTVPAGDD